MKRGFPHWVPSFLTQLSGFLKFSSVKTKCCEGGFFIPLPKFFQQRSWAAVGVAFEGAKVAMPYDERDFNVIQLRLFKESTGGFVAEAVE